MFGQFRLILGFSVGIGGLSALGFGAVADMLGLHSVLPVYCIRTSRSTTGTDSAKNRSRREDDHNVIVDATSEIRRLLTSATLLELPGSAAATLLPLVVSVRLPRPKLYYAASPCGSQDSNAFDPSSRNVDSQNVAPHDDRKTRKSS